MVDPERLLEPEDNFRGCFPKLDFKDTYRFSTHGEPVLVTDPIYLADVYNSKDEVASFLRARGVFVMDFGGDVGGPVWWQHPFLMIAISTHLSEEFETPPGVVALPDGVGTDSGSFIFLPFTDDIPSALQEIIHEVVANKNGILAPIPAGEWAVYYEQWEPKEGYPSTWYRNIVARWEEEAL